MTHRYWYLLIALHVLACSRGAKRDSAKSTDDAAPAAATDGRDPCALVSNTEMEALMGPLAEPPYRVDKDRHADPRGESCFYRAKDRRNVTISPDFEDGELSFKLLAGTGKSVRDILVGQDPETDTIAGGWDKIGSAFGQLIVLKGKVSVEVDPLGSRIGLPGAVRVASAALKRLDAPLSYDGSKAARAHGEDRALTRSPCDLVTRVEIESAMGALRGDPKANEDGDECEFATTQSFMGSPVTRVLKVVWSDGWYAFGQERNGMQGASKIMSAQMGGDIPQLGTNTADSGEPWDERVTLMGGLLTVVRRDVMLQLAADGVGGFNEAKALELLRAAARRL
ncbi:MAG: hypothetical protein U0132_08345 [Gemmatimonadaceae bacterium]